MISESQKEKLVQGMKAYTNAHNISNNKMARLAGISASYISAMVNGKWNEMAAAGKLIKIEDKYFKAVAKVIGMHLNGNVWAHFDTDNYMTIINACDTARATKLPVAIDGESGQGKTYSIHEYKRMNPGNTYVVTSAGDLTSKGFMMELAEAVGVKPAGDRTAIRKEIERKLRNDNNALLIIDEAENLKAGAWDSIKSIMDSLKGYVGIVMVGANDFQQQLYKKASRGTRNFPQIYRRLKEGGFYRLIALNMQDVKMVCQSLGVPADAIPEFQRYASNMGELAGSVIRVTQKGYSLNDLNAELVNTILENYN